jgi:DUF438 domain-containing protein
MSELINNREHRQKVLKDLIRQLHDGKTVEEVRQQFEDTFKDVSATEISEAEQALIMEGMPVTEIQRLCDVHASVFKGSIEEIHAQQPGENTSGHPINTFKRENRALEDLLNGPLEESLQAWLDQDDAANTWQLKQNLALLSELNLHYIKKENIFFPLMEKYNITAPPKVMWGVDDEIRVLVRESLTMVEQNADKQETAAKIEETIARIHEMIFKEEQIMLPMLEEALTTSEWKQAADDFVEIGFCLIEDAPVWIPPVNQAEQAEEQAPAASGQIKLPSGVFKLEELAKMLDTLPFDITFVDKDDTVKYFSQSEERIFPRSKSIIGRKVANCHPPKSVHVVEKIVEDFKSGAKDHEDFWIQMGPAFVLIRYFAVRSDEGEYLGTVEVTQNIGPIQQITGEKRLMSEIGEN